MRRFHVLPWLVLLGLGVCSTAIAAGQAVAMRNAGDQETPAVARNAAGAGVVVWAGPDDPADLTEIFARCYDAAGAPVGDPFQVNQQTHLRQFAPRVAINGDGGFTVVWLDERDAPGIHVYARRFDAGGAPLGSEFQVDGTNSPLVAEAPDVAVNAAGDGVVVWATRKAIGGLSDLDTRTIRGRTIDAAGTPGRAFRAAANPLPLLLDPRAAIGADGDFVITWRSDGQEQFSTGIYARRYNADGRPKGPLPRRVDTRRADVDALNAPVATVAPDGGYAVAWTGYAADSTPVSVFLRRFDANGLASGDAQQIATGLKQPALAYDAEGGLALVADDRDIRLYRFDAAGSQYAVRTIEGERPQRVLAPVIAADASGQALIVWQDFGRDGDGRGVFMAQDIP